MREAGAAARRGRPRAASRCVGARAAGAQTRRRAHPRGSTSPSRSQRDGTLQISESITYDFGVRRTTASCATSSQREHYDENHDRRYRRSTSRASPPIAGTPSAVQDEHEGSVPAAAHRRPRPDHHRRAPLRARRTRSAARRRPFADHDELYWDAIGNQWPVPISNAHVTVDAPAADHARRVLRGPAGQRAARATAHRRTGTARDVRAAVARCGLGPDRRRRPAEGHDPAAAEADPRDSARRSPTRSRSRRSRPGSAAASRSSASRSCVVLATRRGRDRRYTGSAVDAAMGNVTGEEEMVPILAPRSRAGRVHPARRHPARARSARSSTSRRTCSTSPRRSSTSRCAAGSRSPSSNPRQHERHPDYELTATPGKGKGDAARRTSSCCCTSCSTTATTREALRPQVQVPRQPERRSRTRCTTTRSRRAGTASDPTGPAHRWVALALLVLVVGDRPDGARREHDARSGSFRSRVVVTGIALLFAAGRMPARTGKGTAMLSRVRGFRRLFDEGEEDTRAHFAEQHDIFSQYLPYAIVFGCTKKWAKTFEGLAAEQLQTELVRRAATRSTRSCSPSAVDHFGTAATGTMYASMPSSSGSSGFSGGGFSGGRRRRRRRQLVRLRPVGTGTPRAPKLSR